MEDRWPPDSLARTESRRLRCGYYRPTQGEATSDTTAADCARIDAIMASYRGATTHAAKCRNPKCRSDRVVMRGEQQRRADEGMTYIFTCQECHTQWRRG